MFKALELWQKADALRLEAERSGGSITPPAPGSFPVALDAFLLQGPTHDPAAPTNQVVDYVRQVIHSVTH